MQLQAEAFLFDLDGTLIDSHIAVNRVWRQWAIENNLNPDEVARGCQGRRSLDTQQHFAPHLPQPASNLEFIDREAADTGGLIALPGAVDFLRSLPRDRWAIVTSCSAKLARVRMEFLKIPIPDVLVLGDDVARGKPDPQGFLMAADKLGFSPEQCVVFEDAPAGLEAARRAGMRVVTVTAMHSQPARGPLSIVDYRDVKLVCLAPLGVEILTSDHAL